MKSEKVNFYNKSGIKIAGYFDFPDGITPKAYCIFAHCFTCSKDLKSIANINFSLTKFGIACLRFDFSGIGDSEGDFANTNYSSNLDDMNSAIDYLKINFEAPELLIGHSLGGCVAIQAANDLSHVKAVATIGTPSEPDNLSKKLKNTKEKAEQNGFAYSEIGGKKFKFKKEFFDDLKTHVLKPYIENLRKPLLILHSPIDDYTPIENAAQIFQCAKHPKSFISLDNIDHLMLKKKDADFVGTIIAVWSSRYFI